MNLQIVGDEIWFGSWKLGRKPDAMPVTQWEAFCDYENAGPETVEARIDEAVQERERQLEEDFGRVETQLEIAEARVRELEAADAKVQAMKQELKRRMWK